MTNLSIYRIGECYGTGSYPPSDHGPHLTNRLAPNQIPRIIPYFSTDWYVYSLHVGVKMQTCILGMSLPINPWSRESVFW